jgi:hypothetical protein
MHGLPFTLPKRPGARFLDFTSDSLYFQSHKEAIRGTRIILQAKSYQEAGSDARSIIASPLFQCFQ